jgi:cytochrome c oxidase assembly protein Cox11
LANETKWKCLNQISKKRRLKESSLNEFELDLPYEITPLDNLKKSEAFELFQEMLNQEKDERVKKIIDIRYNSDNNKLIPWRVVAKKMKMSIQGCINIHNKFVKRAKEQLNKNYV